MKVTKKTASFADCDPIVLRNKETRRLLFLPSMHDCEKIENANIRGSFVYEKKGKNDEWEELNGERLNQLKKGEGFKLELHSDELLHFFEELRELYQIYEEHGLPERDTHFIKADKQFLSLIESSFDELNSIFTNKEEDSIILLNNLLKWISSKGINSKDFNLLSSFSNIEYSSLQSIINLAKLKEIYSKWEEREKFTNEKYWHDLFKENPIILSQVFSYPMIIYDDEVFVGGKRHDKKGSKIIDFVYKNPYSNSVALIEIKTPNTKIVGNEYRQLFSMSKDLTGAIVQLANYKETFQQQLRSISYEQDMNDNEKERRILSFNPKCILIIGNSEEEFKDNKEKEKAFEHFRSSVNGIDIIAFNELFEKIKILIDLLIQN